MKLEDYGVLTECEVDASGRLLINFTTERDIRVTVNGQTPKLDAEVRTGQRFWQPDGTQTDTPPLDLRGG